jgi:hypothetical protein
MPKPHADLLSRRLANATAVPNSGSNASSSAAGGSYLSGVATFRGQDASLRLLVASGSARPPPLESAAGVVIEGSVFHESYDVRWAGAGGYVLLHSSGYCCGLSVSDWSATVGGWCTAHCAPKAYCNPCLNLKSARNHLQHCGGCWPQQRAAQQPGNGHVQGHGRWAGGLQEAASLRAVNRRGAGCLQHAATWLGSHVL